MRQPYHILATKFARFWKVHRVFPIFLFFLFFLFFVLEEFHEKFSYFGLQKQNGRNTRTRARLGENATTSSGILACPPSLKRTRVFPLYSYFSPKLGTNHSLVFVGKYWLAVDRQTGHQVWNFRIYGAPLALRALPVSRDACISSSLLYFAVHYKRRQNILCQTSSLWSNFEQSSPALSMSSCNLLHNALLILRLTKAS